MKILPRDFRLLMIAAFCVIGLSELVVASVSSSEVPAKQSTRSSSQRVLDVALPMSATVQLAAGGSYTGQLTGFGRESLTLEAGGYAEDISLDEIQQVNFNDNNIVIVVNGRRRSYEVVRGFPVPLKGVPVGSLVLQGSTNLARLNLGNILSDSQFAQISNLEVDEIHAIVRILFESSNLMEIRLKKVREE